MSTSASSAMLTRDHICGETADFEVELLEMTGPNVQGCGGAIMLLEIPFEIVGALCEFLRELIVEVLLPSLVELTKDVRAAF
jgi:hypothetical protein